MLEHPSIRRYSPLFIDVGGSDNPPVRTISRKPRERDPQRLHVGRHEETSSSLVKVQSDPHGDMGSQAEMTWPRSFDMDGRSNNMPKVAKFLVG